MCLHVLSMLFILCILNPFYIKFCVVTCAIIMLVSKTELLLHLRYID